MPKNQEEEKENWQLPEIFNDWPENYKPKRLGLNLLAFPSPFTEYPGHITVPMYLSAEQYAQWWSRAGEGQENEPDSLDAASWHWQNAYHFIRDFKLEGINTSDITQDPTKLPDMRILIWFYKITQPIIFLATSLPNLPGPSNEI